MEHLDVGLEAARARMRKFLGLSYVAVASYNIIMNVIIVWFRGRVQITAS